MKCLRVIAWTILTLISCAASARAEGFLIPFIGYDFSGDSGDCRTITPCTPKQITYGGAVGFMVGGVLGLEGEVAYAPHFFGEGSGLADNSVTTAMVNALAGIPLGPVRLYGAGGVGVIHTDVSQSTSGLYNAVTNNNIGFDLGGGLMVFFSQHVGFRGDVRYLQTFDSLSIAGLNLNNAKLKFGRGTLGLALRF
jgi:opacity protein-like surface antigen